MATIPTLGSTEVTITVISGITEVTSATTVIAIEIATLLTTAVTVIIVTVIIVEATLIAEVTAMENAFVSIRYIISMIPTPLETKPATRYRIVATTARLTALLPTPI
jgi:hypothetical protein